MKWQSTFWSINSISLSTVRAYYSIIYTTNPCHRLLISQLRLNPWITVKCYILTNCSRLLGILRIPYFQYTRPYFGNSLHSLALLCGQFQIAIWISSPRQLSRSFPLVPNCIEMKVCQQKLASCAVPGQPLSLIVESLTSPRSPPNPKHVTSRVQPSQHRDLSARNSAISRAITLLASYYHLQY